MFPPKLHSQHRRSWTLRLLHPLLAFVYTNTHLLGQGRLGENYNTLIYETPGRPKARRPRLVRPCFLLSWTLDIWNMTLTFKAVTFSQSLTRTRLSQWAQLLTTDNPLVNHCGTLVQTDLEVRGWGEEFCEKSSAAAPASDFLISSSVKALSSVT